MVTKEIEFPIIGQKRALKLIKRHLETNNIPSAFLFHGPSGTGKFSLAMFLSSLITGKKPYKDINNILLVYPISKKNSISFIEMQYSSPAPISSIPNPIIPISLIKELIDKLSYATEGKRIVIIKNIEYARNESLNAFLKTLEEPPENTHFIITTDNINGILPTIKSRCTSIPFSRLSSEHIIKIHKKLTGEEISADDMSLKLSGGSYTAFIEKKETTAIVYNELKEAFHKETLSERIIALRNISDKYLDSTSSRQIFTILMEIGKEAFINKHITTIQLDNWIDLVHKAYISFQNNISAEILLYNIALETKTWRF